MSAWFTVARGKPEWEKGIVAELEEELRAAHPALLSERLKLLPEVRDGGTAGAGTFVCPGRFVRKDRLLGT